MKVGVIAWRSWTCCSAGWKAERQCYKLQFMTRSDWFSCILWCRVPWLDFPVPQTEKWKYFCSIILHGSELSLETWNLQGSTRFFKKIHHVGQVTPTRIATHLSDHFPLPVLRELQPLLMPREFIARYNHLDSIFSGIVIQLLPLVVSTYSLERRQKTGTPLPGRMTELRAALLWRELWMFIVPT